MEMQKLLEFRSDPSYSCNIVNNTTAGLDISKIDLNLILNIREYFKSNIKRKIKYSFLFNKYLEEENGKWMSWELHW